MQEDAQAMATLAPKRQSNSVQQQESAIKAAMQAPIWDWPRKEQRKKKDITLVKERWHSLHT